MSAENGDPLAQSVEHHTFNVGVLGSNPKRITPKKEVIRLPSLRIYKNLHFSFQTQRGKDTEPFFLVLWFYSSIFFKDTYTN